MLGSGRITGLISMTSGSRTRVVTFILALAMSSLHAHDEEQFRIVMDMLASIEESHVEYTETKSLSILDSTIEQTGMLSYHAPGTVVREVRQPISETFEVDGDMLIIRRADTETVVQLEANPAIKAFVESFRAILSGNVKLLIEHYQIEFSGTAMKWNLQLSPKGSALRHFIGLIEFEGQQTLVESIEITEPNGDWSRMTLTPASAIPNAK